MFLHYTHHHVVFGFVLQTLWTVDDYIKKAKYTAIVVVEGRVLALDELIPRPDWMGQMLKHIAYLSLYDLAIPGTHQSGAYRPYKTEDSDNPEAKSVYHQEEDITTQLLYGIRFFDLRPVARKYA